MYTERGMALVLVLVFTAALMVFGTAMLTYAVTEQQIADYSSEDKTKYYLAESGLEVGLAALHKDFYRDQEIRGTLGKGNFSVNFSELNENRRTIISEGFLGEYSIKLQVIVENDSEKGLLIVEWLSPY